MAISLSGDEFARMLSGGAALLYQNKKIVNELNVFPIPDGDTGDNMFMTIGSFRDGPSGDTLGSVSAKAANAMLRAAHGNSGAILSKMFMGLAKGFNGLSTADASSLKEATQISIKESYAGLDEPKEGTMLTVYRDAITYANSEIDSCKNLSDWLDKFIEAAEKSLDNTPELLDVLKEAGVVDSGGAGIVYIFQGMKRALLGEAFDVPENVAKTKSVDLSKFTEDSELTFGYCTEFILRLQNKKVDAKAFDENVIKNYLRENGESLVFIREGSLVKVHVHTMTPGEILNYCQKFGEFLTLKIENMNLQHNEAVLEGAYAPKKLKKKTGIVCVGTGSGITGLFIDMGADYVVNGGQSMNPACQDFIDAFREVNAETIYVFPNNSNIILTAKQAGEIFTESEIVVLPTKDLGEGYVALSQFDPNLTADEMTEGLDSVVTGEISKAIRSTDLNGVSVTEGEYVGISGKEVISCEPSKNASAEALLENLGAGAHDILIILCGENTKVEESEALSETLSGKYKRTEIITIRGDQPIYDYIFILN